MSLAARRLMGLIFVVTITGAGLLAAIRPDPFADTRSIWAEFESVQGLGAIDRDIRLAGANVGYIGDVERDGDDARVEIVLERDVVVKEDASADLRPHTLFEGSAFIDLHPGSPSAPELPEGEAIGRDRTTVYITLDEATRILRKPVRESLRDLAKVGARTLRGPAVDGVQRTLEAAPGLTRDLGPVARAAQGANRRELGRSVRNLAETVEEVARRESQIAPLPGRISRTTSGLLVDGGGPLDAAVAQLPGALGSLRREGPAVGDLIDQLDRLAVGVTPALPSLTEALADTPDLLDRAIPIVERGTPIVADLRKISGRLTKAAPDLTTVTSRLRSPSERLSRSILPFLHEDGVLGIPGYLQLMSTFSAANKTARPYQTIAQNPNGAGHIVRLGGYVSPDAAEVEPSERSSGWTAPRCAEVAEIGRRPARRLEAIGWCTR